MFCRQNISARSYPSKYSGKNTPELIVYPCISGEEGGGITLPVDDIAAPF